MSKITVAVIDQYLPPTRAIIEAAMPLGWEALFAENGSRECRQAAMADADIAFVMGAPVDAEMIRGTRRLRFIQKLGAGVDAVDQDMCRERGIALARLNGGNAVPVAEHTLMLMLACYRHLSLADRRTRAGQWDKEAGRAVNRQIRGKRVGIIGFGAIGRELAAILSGLGVEIVYYDPYRAPPDVETGLKAHFLPLDEIVDTADIITLHMPLLPDTRNLINEARIRRMKRGAVIVNCARGGLVDETALAAALDDGHIFAAGLDAFSKEPPVGNPLLACEHAVITPHFAGATIDNFSSVIERAVGNAQAYLERGTLPKGDGVLVPDRNPAATAAQ